MTAPLALAHVLVVHDNPEVREFLAAIIAKTLTGKVETASRATAALRDHPPLDLCVVQTSQLLARGTQLLPGLREHHPRIVVILVSGYPVENEARGLGADFFLQLPASLEDLRKTLRAALVLRSERE